MSERGLYTPFPVVEVKSELIESVKNTAITPEGAPFPKEKAADFSLAVVNEKIDSDNPIQLQRVSDYHRRSFEILPYPEMPTEWRDRYGNLFSALNTKGNSLESPQMEYTESLRIPHYIYGLQEMRYLRRVVRSSEELRRIGVDTETVIFALKPTEFPWGGKTRISPESFKERLLKRYFLQNDIKEETQEHKDASRWSDQAELIFTVRGMQVNERLIDFSHVESEEDFREIIKRAMTHVNESEKNRALLEKRQPQKFDPESKEDVYKYLFEYLPSRIGRNVGKMHGHGLNHGYLHPGNISTVGSIYDNDSIHGEVLGDDPITYQNVFEDLHWIMTESGSFIDDLFSNEIFTGNKKESIRLKGQFYASLIKAYITERKWEDKLPAHAELLAKSTKTSAEYYAIQDYIGRTLEKQYNIKLEIPNAESIFSGFVEFYKQDVIDTFRKQLKEDIFTDAPYALQEILHSDESEFSQREYAFYVYIREKIIHSQLLEKYPKFLPRIGRKHGKNNESYVADFIIFNKLREVLEDSEVNSKIEILDKTLLDENLYAHAIEQEEEKLNNIEPEDIPALKDLTGDLLGGNFKKYYKNGEMIAGKSHYSLEKLLSYLQKTEADLVVSVITEVPERMDDIMYNFFDSLTGAGYCMTDGEIKVDHVKGSVKDATYFAWIQKFENEHRVFINTMENHEKTLENLKALPENITVHAVTLEKELEEFEMWMKEDKDKGQET